MSQDVTAEIARQADDRVLKVVLDGINPGHYEPFTLKSTLRPWLSVIVPSSSICSRIIATSYRDKAKPMLFPNNSSFISLCEPSPTRREVRRLTVGQKQISICDWEWHTIWSPTNSLRKLTSFLKSNIAGSCTNETGDGMTIMELNDSCVSLWTDKEKASPPQTY
jgi:hypothetical protein